MMVGYRYAYWKPATCLGPCGNGIVKRALALSLAQGSVQVSLFAPESILY